VTYHANLLIRLFPEISLVFLPFLGIICIEQNPENRRQKTEHRRQKPVLSAAEGTGFLSRWLDAKMGK